METYALLAKMIGALAMILGILLAVAYLMKRFGLVNQTGGKGFIKVIENRALLPKRHISLVCVAGKYFLIGSTDQSVSLLGAIEVDELKEFGDILKEKEKELAKGDGKR